MWFPIIRNNVANVQIWGKWNGNHLTHNPVTMHSYRSLKIHNSYYGNIYEDKKTWQPCKIFNCFQFNSDSKKYSEDTIIKSAMKTDYRHARNLREEHLEIKKSQTRWLKSNGFPLSYKWQNTNWMGDQTCQSIPVGSWQRMTRQIRRYLRKYFLQMEVVTPF